MSNITFVMPILRRPLMTLRCLWYMNHIKLPWKVIIADGAHDDIMKRILDDPSNLPHLDYHYFQRPDVSPNEFIQKCRIGVSMADTDYILMHENDDFIFTDAIYKSERFLDQNKDHVAAGGCVAGFSLETPNPQDPMHLIQGDIEHWYIMYDILKLTDADPRQRIHKHFNRYHPSYYALHRKDVLLDAFKFVGDTVFKELLMQEMFLSFYSLIEGKVETFGDYIGYIRQTNLGGATLRPWPELLISPRFDHDFRTIIDQYSEVLYRKMDRVMDQKEIQHFMKRKMSEFIASVCNHSIYKDITPGDIHSVVDELKIHGASQAEGDHVLDGIKDVHHVLTSSDFRQFVKEVAPEYLAQGTGEY